MNFLPADERVSYSGLVEFSDERLVLELLGGNADAFAVIFQRYHRLVHVTALNILRDAGEAEDLTQSVFLEFYSKVEQYDPAKGTLKIWLLQYAYSRSMNRRIYLTVRQFQKHMELGAVDESAGTWPSSRMPLQESSHLSREVLAVLEGPQRRTIELFFFEGLTLKEIAERNDESFSNTRHHYYRALERLRAHLEPRKDEAKPVIMTLGEPNRAES